MRRILLTLALLITGCELPVSPGRPITERPVVNVPLALRQSNWISSDGDGDGSCVHATMISLLRWQGRSHTADYWQRNYGGGECPDDMAAKLDRAGIRYAYVTNGDVRFLEWAIKTRRGCGITVLGGAHFVALVYLDDKQAAILDSNDVSKVRWVSRASLIAEWKASFGWALAPVYSPAAPLPR